MFERDHSGVARLNLVLSYHKSIRKEVGKGWLGGVDRLSEGLSFKI
jgi:hypothetical protein